jgi:hypothetical protein
MKGRLAQQAVEQRGVVGLDDEEEQLLDRDGEQGWAEDGRVWIRPDIVPDEVGIPRDGGSDGDLTSRSEGSPGAGQKDQAYRDEEQSLVDVELGRQRVVDEAQERCGRYVPPQMAKSRAGQRVKLRGSRAQRNIGTYTSA